MQTTKPKIQTCQGAIIATLKDHGGDMLQYDLVERVCARFSETFCYSSIRTLAARGHITRYTDSGAKRIRVCGGQE